MSTDQICGSRKPRFGRFSSLAAAVTAGIGGMFSSDPGKQFTDTTSSKQPGALDLLKGSALGQAKRPIKCRAQTAGGAFGRTCNRLTGVAVSRCAVRILRRRHNLQYVHKDVPLVGIKQRLRDTAGHIYLKLTNGMMVRRNRLVGGGL